MASKGKDGRDIEAETDEIIGKTKVSALLEALPKVGKVKAKDNPTQMLSELA